MTWNQLLKVCNSIPEEEKNKTVLIFNFNEGELSFLLQENKVGQFPEHETHCSNFNQYPETFKGRTYLLSDYGRA